ALSIGKSFHEHHYYNWDQTHFKKQWAKNPDSIIEDFIIKNPDDTKLAILDEIHKSRSWKQKLKGLYDVNHDILCFLVTGSARLNIYRKGSDSLMGRYYHFRLHPFSLRELLAKEPLPSNETFRNLFQMGCKKMSGDNARILARLLEFSGFPEPYLANDHKVLNLWREGRKDKIIKEDIRDLSNVRDISQIEVLLELLIDRVGSPLSVQSLREDLSCSHDSVTRWLGHLQELYYYYPVTPYSTSIARSLKKEAKIYLYDWSEVMNEGARFENMVAGHLLKACHFWQDTGEGKCSLHYLRNKDKKEVDFLIVKNKKPFFTIECKLNQVQLDTEYQTFQKVLKCPHIQLVHDSGHYRKINDNTFIMSAEYFLEWFA
ncbi:MAG: AAA family ATPase, partial [Bdellovibrionota bacterium]